MNPLSPRRRSELRAEAHKLTPTVLIGDKGLTAEVLAEIDRSLKAHELIKVRAATAERDARDVWLDEICLKLEAHAVQQIGKVFVLYRENPKEAVVKKAKPAAAPAPLRRVREEAKPSGREADDAKRKRFGLTGEESGRARGKGRGAASGEARRTSRPPPRTPSPRPASGPRRRPRSTSR